MSVSKIVHMTKQPVARVEQCLGLMGTMYHALPTICAIMAYLKKKEKSYTVFSSTDKI